MQYDVSHTSTSLVQFIYRILIGDLKYTLQNFVCDGITGSGMCTRTTACVFTFART